MTEVLLIAAAGGVGAVARFVWDGHLRSRATDYPVGTAIINLTGSLLLGFVTGLALSQLLSAPWALVLGTGFLGGYTTFSTASVETVRLAQERRRLAALLNGLGLLVASVVLAGIGWWVASLI